MEARKRTRKKRKPSIHHAPPAIKMKYLFNFLAASDDDIDNDWRINREVLS